MGFLSRLSAALAVLSFCVPALADVSGGCRCDSGSLVGAALTLPLLAVGALLARRPS
jgi:hypothetical protein